MLKCGVLEREAHGCKCVGQLGSKGYSHHSPCMSSAVSLSCTIVCAFVTMLSSPPELKFTRLRLPRGSLLSRADHRSCHQKIEERLPTHFVLQLHQGCLFGCWGWLPQSNPHRMMQLVVHSFMNCQHARPARPAPEGHLEKVGPGVGTLLSVQLPGSCLQGCLLGLEHRLYLSRAQTGRGKDGEVCATACNLPAPNHLSRRRGRGGQAGARTALYASSTASYVRENAKLLQSLCPSSPCCSSFPIPAHPLPLLQPLSQLVLFRLSLPLSLAPPLQVNSPSSVPLIFACCSSCCTNLLVGAGGAACWSTCPAHVCTDDALPAGAAPRPKRTPARCKACRERNTELRGVMELWLSWLHGNG